MHDEPDLNRQQLAQAVTDGYDLPVDDLEFLATGSDVRSFSYRMDSGDRRFYLKVRTPSPDDPVRPETAAFVMSHVVDALAPHPSTLGSPWVAFEAYQLTLFPLVSGVDGWDFALSAEQGFRIGQCVRSLHDLTLPPGLPSLPRETFSDRWRDRMRSYLEEPIDQAGDLVAHQLLRLLSEKSAVLSELIDQAQALAESLGQETLPLVCCHGDLHSGNFLIADSGTIHPVDWDTLSLAPKEKDLMFLGAGIGGMLDDPKAVRSFYEGYGEVVIHQEALRYFRLERIVQDVVAYCDQLLLSPEGGADREISYHQLARQFEDGAVVEVALRT